MTRFQQFEPSLVEALVNMIPEISALSFSVDSATSVYVDVTLSPGVVNTDQVYNQIIYDLSQIFDVYSGTITWGTVPAGKRQTPNRIIVYFADETQPSSPANILLPFFALLPLLAHLF